MKKRYLKTVEDVLALNGADTKIYVESSSGYYKFVKGVLCHFNAYNGITYFNCPLDMEEDVYILEEEPKQEATTDDIGKLCRFWDDNMTFYRIGKLERINKIEKNNKVCYLYKTETNNAYQHCRRLTTSEITNLI